jgi:hypothetical protein
MELWWSMKTHKWEDVKKKHYTSRQIMWQHIVARYATMKMKIMNWFIGLFRKSPKECRTCGEPNTFPLSTRALFCSSSFHNEQFMKMENFWTSLQNYDMNDGESFCSLIADGRAVLGKSLYDFAQMFHTGAGTISRWEHGHYAPIPIARAAIIKELKLMVEQSNILITGIENEDTITF